MGVRSSEWRYWRRSLVAEDNAAAMAAASVAVGGPCLRVEMAGSSLAMALRGKEAVGKSYDFFNTRNVAEFRIGS